MRIVILFTSSMIACALIFGYSSSSANATAHSFIAALTTPEAVTTVGWRRRYWRRYGEWPAGPRADFDYDSAVPIDGDAVIIAPVRPRSCGQYHYWDGIACVDARYYDPYLGPK